MQAIHALRFDCPEQASHDSRLRQSCRSTKSIQRRSGQTRDSGTTDDLAERIAMDACMADAPDASFDYKDDRLVNRNDDDLKGLAQRENMA